MEANPYKPPAAPLDNGEFPKKRAWWWRAYFWFILVSQSIYTVAIVVAPKAMETKTSDYFDTVIYVGVLLAIYGFVYCKRIFSRKIWQVFFPLILLWDSWSIIFDGDWEQWRQSGPVILIVFIGIFLILMVPQYIALFRYGFREQALWENRGKGA